MKIPLRLSRYEANEIASSLELIPRLNAELQAAAKLIGGLTEVIEHLTSPQKRVVTGFSSQPVKPL